MVVAALDTVSGEKVAIKRLLPFTHRLMCQRTLREIKILRRFKCVTLLHTPFVVPGGGCCGVRRVGHGAATAHSSVLSGLRSH